MIKQLAATTAAVFVCVCALAQQPDKVYKPNIKGVKFFMAGNQTAYPVIGIGSTAATEIHFDDLDGYAKNYNYTYLLCNADWQPADVSPFNYIKGFTQGRFTQYRYSSTAKTRYVHYQATLPEANATPTLSGNYLLLVYLDGDTSKLAFAKRLLVVNNQVGIQAVVQHPVNQDLFLTHQKVQFTIDKTNLNILNQQQQLKVVVLQNYRWDNAITGMQPVFMRGNLYEYNGEQDCVFPAGKEFRWANLESFRYQSERVDSVHEGPKYTDVYLKPDPERSRFRFQAYVDYDGFYQVLSTDVSNAWWQSGYADVHFTFVPANNQPYPGRDVFVGGEFTGYQADDDARMEYNPEKGAYEKTIRLKQGYYSYTYFTKPAGNDAAKPDAALPEGNYWESENSYTILVYYRAFSDRADQLVGVATVNSTGTMR